MLNGDGKAAKGEKALKGDHEALNGDGKANRAMWSS